MTLPRLSLPVLHRFTPSLQMAEDLAGADGDHGAMVRPRPAGSSLIFLAAGPVGAAGALGLAVLLPALATAQPPPEAARDPPVVGRLEIARNQYLSPETFLFYISTKPGDRYDEVRLRADFRRLWATGFLQDLVIDARDTPTGGKAVFFIVSEQPRVQIVDYRGSKALTKSAIEEELKKRDAAVRVDSFYDMRKARRVEAVLREMLAAKGRPFGTVRHETRTLGGAGTQLSFVIDDGPRARIESIDFVGNEVFPDGTLRGRLKALEPAGFWNLSWLAGKTTWTDEKWADPVKGDRRRLEDFYLDRGYVTAQVGEPRLVYRDGEGGKKPSRALHVEIPVTEGAQYRVGEVRIEGMTVFKPDAILPLFKLRRGDVYRESRITKGYDTLRDAYGAQGHFQWVARTDRKPDAATRTVDVTLVMEEDKRYYVGRIVFTGNTVTRDKVIRREVYLSEGDVFNTEALKLSIRRINQLGYFKPMEGAPDLTPSALGDDRLDVTFKVEEQNRNSFTLGGGVSGLEGAFLNASFSTTNFLGSGETLQLSAQTGARASSYQLGISEPYLFDRPITAGIDLFSRKVDYYDADGRLGSSEVRIGGSATAGLPLGRFTRAYANYTYEVIDVAVRDDLTDGTAPTGIGTLPGVLLGEGRNRESRVTPSVVHNTVDNPFTPRSGMRLTGTLQVAGGPLGGTADYLKPTLEAILYVPHLKRTALGLRGQVGWIHPFGAATSVPYYQRFFLGGETQIRGVNARSVGPINASNQALGGDKFALFNAEYYLDVAAPLRLLLFYDAGNAYGEGKPFAVRDLRVSTGVEARFLMPVLNVPFRLIYAWNANRDAFQKKTTFKFAVGTTF